MIRFLLACLVSTHVPAPLCLTSYAAAERHGLSPWVLVSYLETEHPGGRYSGDCSDAGACGPFQLVELWERRYGLDRGCPRESAELFARLVVRAREKHGAGWRESIKCSRSARDTDACRWHGRQWSDTEARLEEPPCGAAERHEP